MHERHKSPLTVVFLCCIALLSTGNIAWATDSDVQYIFASTSAYRDYSSHHYDKAFREYFLLARNTATKQTGLLSENQYRLASMYQNGQGTEKNIANALKWYKKSADNHEMRAMNAIGGIYFFGAEGIPVDYTKAFEWYFKTLNAVKASFDRCTTAKEVEQNKRYIKYIRYDRLGWMKLYGEGTEKDTSLAWTCFQESVEQRKDGYSCYMLGYMAEHADLHPSGKKQLNTALRYYNLAVDKGYEKAKPALDALMRSME